MNWDDFLQNVHDWLAQRKLDQLAARWVLGVSGGPDSTLLLHAMHELSRRYHFEWNLHVAHMHHGLRGDDADGDAAFVRDLAQSFGLPFHEEHADIRAAIARDGGSTEEVARERRYEFLERVALRAGCELVAVAHHADDDAETVLHRICRGTGLRGLAGMRDIRTIQPGSRVRLVRPFLHTRRTTIEEMCRDRKLTWRVDATNTSSEFTRGRIRTRVIPLINSEINPNATEAILRLAEQARRLGTYLEDAAARTLDSLVLQEGRGRIVINARALLSKQKIVQAEVVRLAISLVIGGEQDLAFAHIESVLRLAADMASGKSLHLPGPIIVRKVYDRIEIGPPESTENVESHAPTFITVPGSTYVPMLQAELVAELCEVGDDTIEQRRRSRRPYEEWLDYARIQFPLLVRPRMVGDRFWPLGAPGTKTIADFFGDEKLDPALRSRTGVLCDQLGPLWVMPLRIDERAKLRPTTNRAVRLVLRPHAQPDA